MPRTKYHFDSLPHICRPLSVLTAGAVANIAHTTPIKVDLPCTFRYKTQSQRRNHFLDAIIANASLLYSTKGGW